MNATTLAPLPARAIRAYARIEGACMEAVGETLGIDQAIAVALRYDARRDAHVYAAERTFSWIVREPGRVEELAQIGGEHTRQAQHFDRLAQAHWETIALRHSAACREHGRAGIEVCELMLTERTRTDE